LVGNAIQSGSPKVPETSIPSVTPIRQNQPAPPFRREKNPEIRSADQAALSAVSTAAILSLLGALVGLVAGFGTDVVTVTRTSSETTLSPDRSNLFLFGVLIVVGVILTFLELIYYRRAFTTLEHHDPWFSTPTKLVLLLLVVLPLLLLTVLAFIYAVYEAGVCATSLNNLPSSCLGTVTVSGVVVTLLILGIIFLVGYIGLLIGIWRLGTRYGAVGFKVGAVLLLFPILNLVAVILILVSVSSSRATIAAEASTPSVG
jgi:MFS family permease